METDKGAVKNRLAGSLQKRESHHDGIQRLPWQSRIRRPGGIFHGEIINIRDVITFQGQSVAELTKAFRDSIEDYLQFCEERGESPEKPFS